MPHTPSSRSAAPAAGPALAVLLALLLAGCDSAPFEVPDIGNEVTQLRASAPPGAPDGTCWSRDFTPAEIVTITEQTLVEPPETREDGQVLSTAIYHTETRQEIVKEREEIWFRTPCPAELTPEFVASLQRALAARGLYRGEINGELDAQTGAAIRAIQRPEGLDSATLSLAVARRLGLSVVEIPGVSGAERIPVAVEG